MTQTKSWGMQGNPDGIKKKKSTNHTLCPQKVWTWWGYHVTSWQRKEWKCDLALHRIKSHAAMVPRLWDLNSSLGSFSAVWLTTLSSENTFFPHNGRGLWLVSFSQPTLRENCALNSLLIIVTLRWFYLWNATSHFITIKIYFHSSSAVLTWKDERIL